MRGPKNLLARGRGVVKRRWAGEGSGEVEESFVTSGQTVFFQFCSSPSFRLSAKY